jgi:hypothetical protein
MGAYPDCYLDEIVETQGLLFEHIADLTPTVDVEGFITAYMQSRTRGFIDRADAYTSNLSPRELFEFFCKTDHYTLQPGAGLGGFLPNWLGQFYAYYQWQEGTPSRELIKILPLDFMKAAYPGLHDLDLDLAVAKVAKSLARN